MKNAVGGSVRFYRHGGGGIRRRRGGDPQSVSGAPGQLTLTETWAGRGTMLNDAPCGVADCPSINDGGTTGSKSGTARATSTA